MSTVPIPEPRIDIDQDTGSVYVFQHDGRGNNVSIIASPHAEPWLVRRAMQAMNPQLMPGARREADHA